MDTLSLAARARTQTGRHAAALRRAGGLPGVVYGHHLETTPLELDYRLAERAWARAGRNTLLDLQLESGEVRRVLFREVQVHPRTGRLLHADLFAPNLRIKITAEVPVVLTGEPPAVTTRQGVLLQVANTLKIECLPTDLPHQLVADVSALAEVDSHITVADVHVPDGVTVLSDGGEVVAKIAALRVRDLELEAAAEAGEEESAEGASGASGGGGAEA